MSKTLESLIVIGVPERTLVYSNHAYVNPHHNIKYIQLNHRGIFLVKPHPGVQVGEIALNVPQCESCKLNFGDRTIGRVLDGDAELEMSPLIHLKLELQLVNPKMRAEIAEDDLVSSLKGKYVDQVLMRGQVFAVDVHGSAVKLNVVSCSVGAIKAQVPGRKESEEQKVEPLVTQDTDRKDQKGERPVRGVSFSSDRVQDKVEKAEQSMRYATFGRLCESTLISITTAPNRYLVWHKSANAFEIPDLFRPDWKFEDMGIGGLDKEFQDIFRRSFASRLFPPSVIAQLGIQHVRGMLLHGPPGQNVVFFAML